MQHAGTDRWGCSYCPADQGRATGADAWLVTYLTMGWTVLAVRLLLSAWILVSRRNFLRIHCGCQDHASLLSAISTLAGAPARSNGHLRSGTARHPASS